MPPIMQKKEEREERLAINLFDLDRLDPTIYENLIAGKVDHRQALRMDPSKEGETAVEFNCSLLDAACVIDILRSHDRKAGDYPTRAYLLKSRAWVKIPGKVILTRRVGDKWQLSPRIFPPPPLPEVPPALSRVTL